MAFDQKVDYNPEGRIFRIETKFDQLELALCKDPQRFMSEIEHEIACQVAREVMKRLSPAIRKAIKKSFDAENP